jgi:NAD(P)-dependent dehydrogenase (short-subunit alcohol dehydrogenase family)
MTATYPGLHAAHIVVTGVASGIGQATADPLAAAAPPSSVSTCASLRPRSPGSTTVTSPPRQHRPHRRRDRGVDPGPLQRRRHSPGTFDADRVMAVNVLGLRALTEALLPKMPSCSAVVNVASCAGAGGFGTPGGMTDQITHVHSPW